MKEYNTPDIQVMGLEYDSFICQSIMQLQMMVEVDEYANIGKDRDDHVLIFDSDY